MRGIVVVGIVLAACSLTSEPSFSCSVAAHTPRRSGTAAMVVGDYGSGTDAGRDVAEAMRTAAITLDVAAVITTGDNFYINDGDAAFCDPFAWLVEEGIPVWASWGNHDIEEPARLVLMHEVLGAGDRWYARSLGEWTVLVLDSNQVGSADQLRWLEGRLTALRDRPVIAAFHHPALSCGHHGPYGPVVEHWLPLFEEHGVDLVLTGHDHHYQRFHQAGVTHVVTGAGGHSLRAWEPCPPSTPAPVTAEHDDYSFVVLRAEGDALRLEAVAADGRAIDTAVIENEPVPTSGGL